MFAPPKKGEGEGERASQKVTEMLVPTRRYLRPATSKKAEGNEERLPPKVT